MSSQFTPPNNGQPPAVRSLAIPASGTERVELQAGQDVQFVFDPDAATFSRSGADLVITGENGASIMLANFFAAENAAALPEFILPDGSAVSGADYLRAQNLDISTAAGPAASSPDSGGSGDYADNAGDLLGGLDRLGSLGTDHWGRGSEVPEPALGGTAAGGDSPPGPGPGPQPDPPSGPFDYVARGVMYPGAPMTKAEPGRPQAGGREDAELAVDLLSNGGKGTYPAGQAPASVSLVFYDADGQPIDAPLQYSYDPASGKITFLGAPPDGVYYIQVKDSSGNSYYMQLVIDSNGDFDSAARDAATPPHGGGLSHGEWHSGKGAPLDGRHDVTSSNLDDEMTFAGGIFGAAIKTGHAGNRAWGDDAITVRGDVYDSGIDFGNSTGRLTVNGTVAAQTGKTAVTMAHGAIDINAVSKSGAACGARADAYGDGASTLSINAGDGTVNIKAVGASAAYGVSASYANALADIRAGSVNIEAHGKSSVSGVRALRSATVNLEAQNNLSIGAASSTATAIGVEASSGSTVTMKAGGGLDIDAGGGKASGVAAGGGSTVTIRADSLDIAAMAKDFGKGIHVSGNSAVDITARDVTIKTGGNVSGSNALRNDGGEIAIHSTGGKVVLEAAGAKGWHAGMLAGNGGKNLIEGAREIHIRAGNDGMCAAGGNNIIDGGKVDGDTLRIHAGPAAMYASGGYGGEPSLNHVRGVDNVFLGSGDKRTGGGMVANIDGKNLIEDAKNVEIRATASGMDSRVHSGGKYAGFNHIKGNGHTDVTIDVLGRTGQANAFGMVNNFNSFAWSNRNEISGADEVAIHVSGAANNYAMYSGGGDGNHIQAASVDLDVSGGGKNTAMHAVEGGTNSIVADSVRIDAGDGTAMHAHSNRLDHSPSVNTVTGSRIDITGDIIAARNTAWGGSTADSVNEIHGTGKDDTVTIHGDMKGWSHSDGKGGHYGNIIDTGGGDDTVRISGNARGTFIGTGAGNDHVAITGTVDTVHIDLGAGNDHLTLRSFISGLLDGGGDYDVLILDLDGLGGEKAFGSAGAFRGLFEDGAVKGFEELLLDMSGGSGDALDLGALLNSLKDLGHGDDVTVRIKGDADDHVDIQKLIDNGWSCHDNGDGTSRWTSADEAALTIIIQNGL